MTSKIVPHLWFAKDAEGAAKYYVSLLPDTSRIDSVTVMPADTPSGPEGAVTVVEFNLAGSDFMAMNAGELDPFNHAVSFMINCDTQAEIDRLWNKLKGDGGKPEQCGWIADKYGVLWQIVPRMLQEKMKSPDKAAARRLIEAMLKMVKLDIAELEKAFSG